MRSMGISGLLQFCRDRIPSRSEDVTWVGIEEPTSNRAPYVRESCFWGLDLRVFKLGALRRCGVVSPSKTLHSTSSLSRQITNYYTTHATITILNGWIGKRVRWRESCVLIGYPRGQDGPPLPAQDFTGWSRKKSSLSGHIITLLLAELVATRRLNAGLVIFCIFIDLDFV